MTSSSEVAVRHIGHRYPITIGVLLLLVMWFTLWLLRVVS